ncbi:uncharacterized protein FOMMEDRAFT_143044 [Fomitiporia mediterranea MF3/22]|uniref:uncharacterized protein n=1 Tax=Fomitiporia mediterranea (strain MF3/22) TaxID=694068 RepID=UPI0004408270|nr:uncharacterized protein FOMMEDRAFT_143044 [Fomitiporia mediterranea MF3/22]EJC98581.1 hypothetical protein FOMMEDRAFT_143044 [Fomitiporia mediterranea MF3/22]
MAKGKNLNPADALRKAQRKKELKKNKEQRQRNRDFVLVKKDTSELEDEVAVLEKSAELTKAQSSRLSELKAELAKVMKKKEEYVTEHPEQRNLVYRRRREKEGDQEKTDTVPPEKRKRNLFNKNGLPKHPERSVYYDPVMNPYGMPPPGMPYAERALLPGEVDSEAESAGSDASDDDIPMPDGPPPDASNDNDDQSDEDIPLPDGPPPDAAEELPSEPPLPPGPPPLPLGLPPTMPPFAPNFAPQLVTGIPFPPASVMSATGQGLPPLPPPPPPGFSYSVAPVPPPPPGFFSRRGQRLAPGAMQDPLSDIPHQTYQAHRVARAAAGSNSTLTPSTLPINPSLPAKPVSADPGASNPPKRDVDSSATVSAEPQLRDFKKESTAFVPAALKRKKVGGATSGRVNAAPSIGAETTGDASGDNVTGEDVKTAPKPDLLGSLREKFGPMANSANATADDGESGAKKRKIERPKDDYDKFLTEMGDMLNAQS